MFMLPAASGWTPRQLDGLPDNCHFRQRQIDHGLVLAHSDYRLQRPVVQQATRSDEGAALIITIGLQGASGYDMNDGTRLRFEAGHTTVSVLRHGSGERRLDGGKHIEQLRVWVSEAMLARYAPALAARLPPEGVTPLMHAATTPAVAAQAAALLRASDPLAVHVGALSVLGEQLRLLPLPQEDAKPARASAAQIAAIERAHGLMQDQLAQELTLDYLCLQVGLSQFKFKQLWRYRYNDSPWRTLLALRMQRAHALLEAGCQVAQAGWQVGYRHPPNFSAAFVRYFGYAPKSVRRHA